MSIRILYIEDEPFLGKIVRESLELRGFDVMLVADGSEVMDAFRKYNPDLCVLDVMLPNVDGYTLGKTLCSLNPDMPIIYLTAKSQTEDLVNGFQSGGTDYIKKPFSLEELTARINNQLNLRERKQRKIDADDESIPIGKYAFLPSLYQLKLGEKIFHLSHREAQVLQKFCEHKNRIVERKFLLLSVWGDDSFFNSRTLDVYIRKLREYLSFDPEIRIITLKGKGYHFRVKDLSDGT
jgi:DNA-binding response OmpR family regulator